MELLHTVLKSVTALALVALVAGCATAELKEKEDLAVAAGFKAITPSTPEQVALLPKLPAGKVTPITYKGKKYYVLPDFKNNQAFVGGPKQYQAYQQLRLVKQISNDNLMAAEMNQNASMNWGAWGGWGGGFGPGWY